MSQSKDVHISSPRYSVSLLNGQFYKWAVIGSPIEGTDFVLVMEVRLVGLRNGEREAVWMKVDGGFFVMIS